MSVTEKFSAIRKGLLEFLILTHRLQRQGLRRRHAEAARATTEFATQEGTLYPLLSKMRRDGLVDYEWQESDAGPPRKYYRAHGQGQIAARRAERLLEMHQRHDQPAGTMSHAESHHDQPERQRVSARRGRATTRSRAISNGPSCSSKDNPDRAEIIADLEQAIADKCRRFLGPHKTVVTAAEVEQIIREMGPVRRFRHRGHAAWRRLGAQGLGRSRRRRRRASAALPDSRGRDARGRLQRARGLSAHRRDDRPHRVPASRAGDSRRLRASCISCSPSSFRRPIHRSNGPPRTASRSTRAS